MVILVGVMVYFIAFHWDVRNDVRHLPGVYVPSEPSPSADSVIHHRDFKG